MELEPYKIRLYLYLLSRLYTPPLLHLRPIYTQDRAYKQYPAVNGATRPRL